MKIRFFLIIMTVGIMKLFSQPTDYIGYWPLDGNANDTSSNGLDGTIVGAIPSEGYLGISNTSMYFDGTDDYIVVPNSSIFQPGEGSFSVAFWMKPDVKSNVRLIDIRGTGSGGSYKGYQFKIYTTGSEWYIYDAGIDDATGNYKLCAACGGLYTCDEWHHVVMVYEADSELRFYVDGSLDGSVSIGTYGSLSNTLPLSFGAAVSSIGVYNPPTTVSQLFIGKMDEIYMFDRVLSETEVAWLAGKLSIDFSYDNAGNRLERTINLGTGAAKSAQRFQQPIMEDTSLVAQINLYPNPTQGEIFLQIIQEDEIQKASVNVYSSSGKIIFSRRIYDLEERIDLSDNAPGMYLIVVNVNDKQQVWRIIKE